MNYVLLIFTYLNSPSSSRSNSDRENSTIASASCPCNRLANVSVKWGQTAHPSVSSVYQNVWWLIPFCLGRLVIYYHIGGDNPYNFITAKRREGTRKRKIIQDSRDTTMPRSIGLIRRAFKGIILHSYGATHVWEYEGAIESNVNLKKM